MPQKKCDWIGCFEIGFFDGLDKTLLTEEGKKHIFASLKLIFLCPNHFKLGVGRRADVHCNALSHKNDQLQRLSIFETESLLRLNILRVIL